MSEQQQGTIMNAKWAPDSWRTKPVSQVPDYPDAAKLQSVEERLKSYPPLVFAGEARRLQEALGNVAEGLAFRHIAQRFLEPPRLAGKHQRRIALQALFHRLEFGRIRVVRNLRHRLGPPAVRRPLRVHDGPLLLLAHPTWESIISRTLSRRAFRMARKLTCGAGRNNPEFLL